MWSRVSLVLAVMAFASAGKEWPYKSRMPTVTPNIRDIPLDKIIEETYKPIAFIPGWKKAVENCGRSQIQPNTRIVGGNEAVPHSYPWQVGLFLDNNSFCGGSIIDTNWVLTAAHCTAGVASVRVVAGAHDIRDSTEASQVAYTSTDIITHENYGPLLLSNDIALIEIKGNITFTEAIQPICLPSKTQADLGAGELVTQSGWGKTSDAAVSISDKLNEVTTETITNEDCAAVYGSVINSGTICTDTTGSHGTCSGDSGGPLNHLTNGDGTYFTQGVTSFVSSTGCEAGYPAGFTRVTSYLDWIETKTGLSLP